MLITLEHKNKAVIIFIILILSFLGISVKLFYLQIIRNKDYSKKVDKQYITSLSLKTERGVIYDSQMKELAISIKVDSIFAVPQKIEDKEKISIKLAEILKLKSNELLNKINQKKNFVWIKRQVLPDEAFLVLKENFKGIYFLKEDKRYYPNKTLASHILGFVNIDDKGLEGIECYYDEVLKGNTKKLIVRQDARGKLIILPEKNEEKIENGNNLKLTIDLAIQHIVERELSKIFFERKAKSALAIVIEPQTGKILALANQPDFNPNLYRVYLKGSLRNRCITDVFEPGSTFKIFLAAAALEEGIFKPEDMIYCEEGKFHTGSNLLHDVHSYGWLTFKEVIEKSSNIGAVKIGVNLGAITLYKYLQNFGIGIKTEIDLPGEVKGTLRKPNQWSKTSIFAVPIGQEVCVTAIQLITAMTSLVNGGILVKPYLVDEIINSQGKVIKKNLPLKIKKVASFKTIATLNEILKGVVCNGTGRAASIVNYEVAGKTGTAQKVDSETKLYSKNKFVSSFVGYLPADDPQLAILVVVDEPQGYYYGGEVAAPVFKKIAEECLSYLEILPKNNLVKEEEKIKKKETLKVAYIDNIKEEIIMPDFTGKTMRETLEILWKLNLKPNFKGSGQVINQNPLANDEVKIDTECVINFN